MAYRKRDEGGLFGGQLPKVTKKKLKDVLNSASLKQELERRKQRCAKKKESRKKSVSA